MSSFLPPSIHPPTRGEAESVMGHHDDDDDNNDDIVVRRSRCHRVRRRLDNDSDMARCLTTLASLGDDGDVVPASEENGTHNAYTTIATTTMMNSTKTLLAKRRNRLVRNVLRWCRDASSCSHHKADAEADDEDTENAGSANRQIVAAGEGDINDNDEYGVGIDGETDKTLVSEVSSMLGDASRRGYYRCIRMPLRQPKKTLALAVPAEIGNEEYDEKGGSRGRVYDEHKRKIFRDNDGHRRSSSSSVAVSPPVQMLPLHMLTCPGDEVTTSDIFKEEEGGGWINQQLRQDEQTTSVVDVLVVVAVVQLTKAAVDHTTERDVDRDVVVVEVRYQLFRSINEPQENHHHHTAEAAVGSSSPLLFPSATDEKNQVVVPCQNRRCRHRNVVVLAILPSQQLYHPQQHQPRLLLPKLSQSTHYTWTSHLIHWENNYIRLITLNAYTATLGGGYYLCRHLSTAIRLARYQRAIAYALNDHVLAGRCTVNEAYNFIHAGYTYAALSLIRRAKGEAVRLKDSTLYNMCRAAKVFAKRVRDAAMYEEEEDVEGRGDDGGTTTKILKQRREGHDRNKRPMTTKTTTTVDDYQRIRIVRDRGAGASGNRRRS